MTSRDEILKDVVESIYEHPEHYIVTEELVVARTSDIAIVTKHDAQAIGGALGRAWREGGLPDDWSVRKYAQGVWVFR